MRGRQLCRQVRTRRAALTASWTREAGVSLVELMVVTSFLLIVTAAIWSMLDSGLRVQTTVNDSILAQDNARLGMDQLVKEIRAVKNWSTSTPMSGTELQFVEVSGIANESHLITYSLDQSDMNRQKLMRTDVKRVNGVVVSTTTTTVADYIINSTGEPLFQYFDAWQHEIATATLRPGSTRLVAILLVVKTNRASPTGEITLTSSVAMRN